jgi:HSP20 family protein
MKEQFSFDLNRILEEVFGAAEDFKKAFEGGFGCGAGAFKHGFSWDENVDYYPTYMYPPTNVYLTQDKHLVFEFALSGFEEKTIELHFKGDYMILSAKVPESTVEPENVRYFKRRLKLKNIEEQRYYAPESKFDRDSVKAVFRNGLLKVDIPPKEGYKSEEGIKVEIVKEGE